MIAPIACVVGIVYAITDHFRWAVVGGWAFTTMGIGLLAMLDSRKSLVADIFLNLLSGIGIGLLLPSLTLSILKASRSKLNGLVDLFKVSTVLSWLGRAFGVVTAGAVFRHALQSRLAATKFSNEAGEMTRHTIVLMHSIIQMPASEDKDILIRVCESSLREVWLTMTALAFIGLLLSCFTPSVKMEVKHKEQDTNSDETRSVDTLQPTHESELGREFEEGKL